MSLPHLASFGTFLSPISSEMVVSDCVKLNFVDIDKDFIYFDEICPSEEGRTLICRQKKEGQEEVILPITFSSRTKAHEYGGKSFFIKDNDIFFISESDQQIYKIDSQHKIEPITISHKEDIRYADLIFDKKRNLLFCVQEYHKNSSEIINSIISIDLSTKEKKMVAQGHDFYSSLALSPNKKKLSYICWDHPFMPWNSSYLIENDLSEDGEITSSKKISGGEDESVCQPSYCLDNVLYFISDKTGFYNIYYFKDSIEPLFPLEAEFAYPMWQFGYSTYCFVQIDGEVNVVAIYTKKGKDFLVSISLKDKKMKDIPLPFSYYFNIKAYKEKIVFLAASPYEEKCILFLNINTSSFQILKRSRDLQLDNKYISQPEMIECENINGDKIYGYYYPPINPDYVSPKEELPPLIVVAHGGPTGHFNTALDLQLQYFTSRGFAVGLVNYSGSSGYGRAYKDRLKGKWGELDVADCVFFAKFLVKEKKADINRVVIKGSSAGGYTALAASTFLDFFKAGVSYYGVCDLKLLTIYTHKFESHYLDSLIGPYPEREDLYFLRSPINYIDRLSSPLLLLQGKEDKIVPKEQAEMMFEAVKRKKIKSAILLFEKEGHGFRHKKTLKKALEAELFFYSKIFNLKLKENIHPIHIDN